ncbi:PIG-L family deacetylase [Arthrobacter sp. NA-172]|uniref:PIG-L family deacetylase n=1 Tax=Arthrobacter sp. NA-172 TaxID=3367524 RepID=UPI0037543517
MVTFAHADAGTAEDEWLKAGVDLLPELPLDDAELAGRTVVVLAAHPDDETLGAGGLITRLVDLGAAVSVVLCSAGEASHPHSPTTTPSELAARRLREFEDAMAALGVGGRWMFLRLPDGQLGRHRSAIRDALRAAVGNAAGGSQPSNVVLVAPLRNDGHTDHDVAGSVAAELAEASGYGLLEYPIWYWLWANAADERWRRWVRSEMTARGREAKFAALQAHRSQMEPLSGQPGDEALLQERFVDHFRRTWETFAWTPPSGSHTAADAERVFDVVHLASSDPWDYASSWYEKRKRALTMAALPDQRYARGLELGCSTGVLSAELAQRCEQLLCVDASGKALEWADARLADNPGATTAHMTVPAQWPDGRFDLVVISEVGYYLSPAELDAVLDKSVDSLLPGGTLVMCHWRRPISGWSLDGDSVHAAARARLRWPSSAVYREKDFILETFIAAAPGSADARA